MLIELNINMENVLYFLNNTRSSNPLFYALQKEKIATKIAVKIASETGLKVVPEQRIVPEQLKSLLGIAGKLMAFITDS